ncbi:4-alpha-glucanotransferase dpe2 [Castilleja foliolosa]|uniref:4-alpha-glucanotransferase dpe2 n=1 Tax=Castilleja foliolosa TaxID=1961234 RepID=A0ABD3DBF7_9LAMI
MAKKMVNLGLFSTRKASNTVILCFKIPYYTQWGQNLLACGSEPILGSWNLKKGLLLKPSHQGDELIWSGNLSVSPGFNGEYSYYVVDDEKNVLRWEAGKKGKMLLPIGVQNGQLAELRDLWQTGSDDLPLKSSVGVQFRICCPNVEKDTSIYVIGSPLKLGNWKTEDEMPLRGAGVAIPMFSVRSDADLGVVSFLI